MDKPVYLLDSNVLIDAHRRYYAFDLAPKFWDSLIIHSKEKRICSIDKVKDEIKKGNENKEGGDEPLWKWVKSHFDHSFRSTDDDDVHKEYKNLMVWANANEQYLPAAKAEFASVADAWLIAYAIAKKYVLVTDEKSDEKIRNRIKIPNVCRAFNVTCVGTFDMLRKLGVKFD